MFVQMCSKSIELFFKNVIELSPDEELDGQTELLLTTTSMAHGHYLLPKRQGGSSVKRKANTDRG
jgi:hypothetical protein